MRAKRAILSQTSPIESSVTLESDLLTEACLSLLIADTGNVPAAAHTRAGMVRVHGRDLATYDMTLVARTGGSAASMTAWQADTSVNAKVCVRVFVCV